MWHLTCILRIALLATGFTAEIETITGPRKDTMSTRARSVLLFAFVLLAIWLPRAVALDRVVTPDEHIWLARSANFYYAVGHAEPGGTLQFVHPGVTVMWVGAAAYLLDYPSYIQDAPGQVHQWADGALRNVLVANGRTPMEMLIATRAAIVIAHTLILGFAFLHAIRLLGRGPATVGILLIAFSPFQIGLGQLLHVDAMTGNLMFLSTLALLNYRFRGERRRDLLISGVVAGLAWLTRSPALFLLPYAGLVMLTALGSRWHRHRNVQLAVWWRTGRVYLGWVGLGLATVVILWPAMWVEPVDILTKMYTVTAKMASTGHELPIFYAGRIITGDPGTLFYPVTYLWRSTPISLIGLGLATVALVSRKPRLVRADNHGPLLMLVLFGLFFFVFMGMGAKKFDRYLLPAYPPLDLVAGVGWFAAASWFRSNHRRVVRFSAPAVLIVAIGLQGVSAGLAYPYYLSYYNPVLGGASAAVETMMVGWGEGLDQVADFLNAQPNADGIQVMTRVWPSSLFYMMSGRLFFTKFAPDMHTLAGWLSSDYYVMYVTEMQRGMIPRQLLNYFAHREPVKVARVHGVPYAYVYDTRSGPIPAFLVANDSCATDFDGSVRFLAYLWGEAPAEPSGEQQVTVYFQTLQPIKEATRVRLRLLTEGGRLIAADEAALPSSSPREVTPLIFHYVIPRGMTADTTRFSMTVYDPGTGNSLQAEDTHSGRSRGRTARLHC